MTFELAVQTAVFLKAILLGVGSGVLYDVCRAVRRIWHTGRVVTGLLDGLFWLICLGALFLFEMTDAAGQVRGYVLAGEGLGLALYFLSFSPIVLPLLISLLRAAAFAVCLPVRVGAVCAGRIRSWHQGRKKNGRIIKNLKKRLPFFRG